MERIVRAETELEGIRSRCEACEARKLPDFENRIRSLEAKLAYGAGGLAALQVGCTILLAILKK